MTLWVAVYQSKLPSSKILYCEHSHCVIGYVFILPREPLRPCRQRVTWFNGWESLMVSHYAAKFSDHRDCGSGDTNIHRNMVNLPQMQHVTSLIVYVWTLTSVIFISFKAHSMSCSYIENFKLKKHLFYKYFPVSAMRFFWE